MKVIKDDRVLVQMCDLDALALYNLDIPESILKKIVKLQDNSNIGRFYFIKFYEKEEIEYLKKLDWIIDYNEIKDKTYNGLLKMIGELRSKYDSMKLTEERFRAYAKLNEKNNSLPNSFINISDYVSVMNEKSRKIDLKINSLKNYILYSYYPNDFNSDNKSYVKSLKNNNIL